MKYYQVIIFSSWIQHLRLSNTCLELAFFSWVKRTSNSLGLAPLALPNRTPIGLQIIEEGKNPKVSSKFLWKKMYDKCPSSSWLINVPPWFFHVISFLLNVSFPLFLNQRSSIHIETFSDHPPHFWKQYLGSRKAWIFLIWQKGVNQTGSI